MDNEKFSAQPVAIIDPNDCVETKEDLDGTHITATEKPGDIETDQDQNVDELKPKFLEVRAAAEAGDDATMPAETFRAYTIALVLTVLGSTASAITDLRTQPLVIAPSIVQLLSLPIGKFWARYMPNRTVSLGRWSFKLNPGPFTIKEHALIVIMANVGVGEPPYALGLVIVQMVKYSTSPSKRRLTLEQNFGVLYNALLLIGTEMIGFGLAGVCRRWLVYPSDMIWPSVLQTSTFLNTMHRDKNIPIGRWTISRYKLFFISMIACFCYQILPQLIPFLAHPDFITPIWPNSKIVNTLFGMRYGLALLPITFSYQTIISFLGMS